MNKPTVDKGVNRFITITESMPDFLKVAAQGVDKNSIGSHLSWAGGRDLAESIKYIRDGATVNERGYRTTRELIDKIDSGLHDRHVVQWMPSVVGAYPIVPEYLAGEPGHMRMRQLVESEAAPVRVVVEVMVSAGVGEDAIIRRGAAIAALVMRMSEERPVELWASYHTVSHAIPEFVCTGRVQLDSHPISLAQCVAVLTSTSFARTVCFNHVSTVTGESLIGGGWEGTVGSEKRGKLLRRLLQLEPQDVFMQGGYLDDAELFERDPVAWVNAQLEKQRVLDRSE
jgi:hypothetical protein